MTSRSHTPAASSSSSSRNPLESLVISLVPSLAPSRDRRDSKDGSRSASRASGRSVALPTAEEERAKRHKVRELVQLCEEILDSQGSSKLTLSPSALPDAARRLLAQSSSSSSSRIGSRHSALGDPESSTDKAMRFGIIWNKLEKGKTLASPLPHLQFLMALSEYQVPLALPNGSRTLPASHNRQTTMAPPPLPASSSSSSQQTASSSRQPLNVRPASNLPTPLPPPNVLPDWKGKGKSRAEVLRLWRTSQSRPPFPEHLLLRDTLYLLQGVDGRYVRFALRPPKEQNPYLTEAGKAGEGTGFALGKDGGAGLIEDGEEGDVIGIDIVADEVADGYISKPTRTLLVQISEMGMLYRQVTTFIDSREAGISKGGMTEQSLCHFLHHELSECHRLLAVLESQMTLSARPENQMSQEDPAESSSGGLTLLRLGLWTEEMRLKMRLMAAVVEDAKVAHGGALVSRIHQQTNHGDPFVRTFMNRILEEVSKPFFATLQRWIFSGELHDPFQEFFVQLNPEISTRDDRQSPYQSADMGFESGFGGVGGGDEAHKVWEKKYVFVKGMVPGFVSEEFGRKIFSTGRGLNFIRYSCHDSDWIQTQAKLANAGRALKYSDLSGLERSIDVAYSIASQRLLEVFFDKFMLLDHLKALKSYLMLGAGDFAELLLEAISPRLGKPAISLYRHHLTSDLETAIRGSNAQYDSPDVLRRLDARILEYSHGEIGWDCFALEYKVEAPLNAVLDTKAMIGYDKVFRHLWRLKRVESTLTKGWMRVTCQSKLFEKISNVKADWHHCRIVQAEMVHFIRQIQAYCQLEVIECSWESMMQYMSKREGDMDALIQAHRAYIDRIVRKILLLGSSKSDKEDTLLNHVRAALTSTLQFKDATDELYAWSLGEATRLDRERDEERGLYTANPSSEADDMAKSLSQLRSIRVRIRTCSIEFQQHVVTFCQLTGTHPDLDIRFLGIRIAFNGHYELKKPKKSSKSVRG